jgi:uncharacterized repeat protein (TIGR01451 family)
MLAGIFARLLPLILLCHFFPVSADAQQPNSPPNLNLGDAVVTGFSGTIAPDPAKPRPANKSAVDLTFINPDGASARIIGIGRPGFVWDGRLLPTPRTFDTFAKDVGQVFGVALDDQQPASNIYLAATSAFGLNLVGRGSDGQPERRKIGGPGAGWMKGQFGLDLQGDPGSIYKVDGATGVITLFAKVVLDGVPNPGAALGNLAYDAAHKQLFVSDLYTGMIHRLAVADGSEPGAPYDHGVSGRSAANLPPMPFNPASRPNIASSKFNSENPDTWGFAPPERRVWGLAVQAGRLFYSVRNGSVTEGPQIWSVGIAQDGGFGTDARLEIEVAAQPGPYPVSDIAFSQNGAMILAQRAPITASYDYSAFTKPGEPRVLRYWPKDANDPPSPGLWKPMPEEYAIGFAGTYRNTDGGVALGYGYGPDGMIDTGACEAALWTTGQNLRNNPALRSQLEPGGPLLVNGLQGSPEDMVRSANEPPAVSYFIDYDDTFDDSRASGHMGSVRILARPCAGQVVAGNPGRTSSPPLVSGPQTPSTTTPGCIGPNCGPPPVTPVNIAIKKTAGAVKYEEKTGLWTVEFKLDVSNAGNPFAPGNSIFISDPVQAGLTLVSAVGTAWTCTPALPISSGNLHCGYSFGSGVFNAGAHLNQLILTFTTRTPGKYENCATVGVAPGSGFIETTQSDNRSCDTVEVKRNIDVAIVKTGKAVQVGDMPAPGVSNFTFTLAVTNVGPAFAGNNAITVTDVVPAGMTFTSASGLPDWTCAPANVPAGGTLTCTYVGSGPAAPGASLGSITINATAKGDGPWENCSAVAPAASVGVDTDPSNNKSCVTVKSDGFTPVTPPPKIAMSCGMNVIFVVDVSGSIAQAGATNQVQTALNSAKPLFNNVNASGVQAQGAVITFSDTATLLQPMSAATLTTPAALTFGGETNWEAAMQLAQTTAAASPTPVIIIFITDGIPNRIVGSPNTVDSVTATNAAIPFVNQIYASGVPILGLGIFNADPVNGPIHLHALLGGNDSGSSFGGLYGDLQSFAKNMCPDLYLTKYMNPGSINYHNNPGPHTASIILTLQNTGGAVTGVQVKDALPPGLTNPTSTDPAFSSVGNVVTWNVGSMAANTTVTLTFTITIVPPPLSCNWSMIPNFAQVTHVDQTIHSIPNSFPAPGIAGPVKEHDEASANLWLQDCTPVQGAPYLQVIKSSLESCLPAGQQTSIPNPPPACTFTVQIQAIGNFVGNVVFGDAVFTSPGGAPVASALSSVTLTPPPLPSTQTYCASSFTTTAAQCTQNNVTLNNGHVIKYTFTLAAPPNLAPGNYKNCFMAAQDALSAAQQGVPYYDTNSPVSQWYPWGDCGVFTVPTPGVAKLAAPTCHPDSTKREGNSCVCRFPSMIKSSQTACICPADMKLVPGAGCFPQVRCTAPLVLNTAGTECIRPPVCSPPLVQGPIPGQCICPPGTLFNGKECVRPHTCPPPLVIGPADQCICPQGTVLAGKECVKRTTCQPPMVPAPGATGLCICPPGTVQKGKECVKQEACKPPMVPGPGAGVAAGGSQCVCPKGTVQQGRRCVAPIECRSPLIPNAAGTDCVCRPGLVRKGRTCVELVVCTPPARLNRDGDCQCPRDMVAKGNRCVERDRPIPRDPPRGGGRDNEPPRGGHDNGPPRGGGRDSDPPRGGQGMDFPGRR